MWTRPEGIGTSFALDGYICQRYLGTRPASTTSAATTTTTDTSSFPVQSGCGQLHDQCGGDQNYQGPRCCVSGLECEYKDDAYSQCLKPEQSTYTCSQIHQQCGGADWSGFTCCAEGLICVYGNKHFSQCLRLPGALVQETAVAEQQKGAVPRPRLRRGKRSAAAKMEASPWLAQRSSEVRRARDDL